MAQPEVWSSRGMAQRAGVVSVRALLGYIVAQARRRRGRDFGVGMTRSGEKPRHPRLLRAALFYGWRCVRQPCRWRYLAVSAAAGVAGGTES